MASSQAVLVNGKLISGKEKAEYAKKHGLCDRCVETRTHRVVRKFLKVHLEPITEENDQGGYTVYKGYCLQPTCYTLEQARSLLQEKNPRRRVNGRKSHANHNGQQQQPLYNGSNVQTAQVEAAPERQFDSTAFESVCSTLSENSSYNSLDPGNRKQQFQTNNNNDPNGHQGRQNYRTTSRGFLPAQKSNESLSSNSRGSVVSGGSQTSNSLMAASAASPQSPRSDGSSTVRTASVSRTSPTPESANRMNCSFSPGPTPPSSGHKMNSASFSSGSATPGSATPGSGRARNRFVASVHAVTVAQQGMTRSRQAASFTVSPSPRSATNHHAASRRASEFPPNKMPSTQIPPPPLGLSPSSQQYHLDSITRKRIREMQEAMEVSDFITLLNTLENHGSNHDVAEQGFALLRLGVIRKHSQNPNSGIFSSEGWVKVIKTKIVSECRHEALATLATIVALYPRYSANVLKRDGVDAIFSVDCDDEQMEELCYAVMEILAEHGQDAWKKKHLEKAVPKLMAKLEKGDIVGRDHAIRAIYYLSFVKNADVMIRNAASSAVILSVCDFIKAEGQSDFDTGAALQLLWRLSAGLDGSDTGDGQSFRKAWKMIVEAALHAINNLQSLWVMEAACGLLSGLASEEHSDTTFPPSLMGTSIHRLCQIMRIHEDNEELQLSAMQALSAIIAVSSRKAGVDREVDREMEEVILVVKAMVQRFPNNVEIQGSGCLVLAHIHASGPDARRWMAMHGGVELIVTIFRQAVAENTSTADDTHKAAACAALSSIASDEQFSKQLCESGTLACVQTAMERESTPDMKTSLQLLFTTLVGTAIKSRSGSDHHRSNLQVLLNVCTNTTNIRMAESVMLQISESMGSSAGAVDSLLTMDHGLQQILDLMRRHKQSGIVQQEGCAILARIYHRIPFRGSLSQSSTVGNTSFQTHTIHEFRMIHSAMRNFQKQSDVQEMSQMALANFLAPACQSNMTVPPEISSLLPTICFDAIDCMSIHELSPSTLCSSIHLLWTLTQVGTGPQREKWINSLIMKMFEAMSQNPDESSLHDICCEVLISLVDEEACEKLLVSTEGITALFRTLRAGSETSVETACEILSILLKRNFQTSSQVMNADNAIESLISCMDLYALSSEKIQTYMCSILESLVKLEDAYVAGLVAITGGLRAVCDALRNHGQNTALVENGCRALASVVNEAHEDVVRSIRVLTGEVLTRLLEDHRNNEKVVCAVSDAFWSLCRRDDYFSGLLLRNNCVQVLVEAMQRNLGSAELQRSCCTVLWVISCYGDSKRLVGDCGGISAIINGMLAHTSATALQKEALTALKNLATLNSNKRMIEAFDGEWAIICSMLTNINDSTLVAIGFSALNNYAVDQENRRIAPMQDVALSIILHAMRQFPHEELVQKNACYILKSYTFDDTSCELLCSRADKLVPLLMMAAETFPESCRDRSTFVMERVS